jgi:adenylate cyclase
MRVEAERGTDAVHRNMSPNLRYLNLSGNKRLEIKPEPHSHIRDQAHTKERRHLADFENMQHLRMIGLMDVTTTFMENVPGESLERRVRTTASDVGSMTYGIADTVGKNEALSMWDLVVPRFRENRREALFAMFGRAQALGSNNRLAKFLHEHFATVLREHLAQEPKMDGVPDSLRRTFLALNKYSYEALSPLTGRKSSVASTATAHGPGRKDEVPAGGASGIVVYVVDQIMFVANVGNALAVVSRGGQAMPVSKKHDPWDREEAARIRSAEGWISPAGLTNNEVDLSRSFGFYKLAPVISCCPTVNVHELDMTDDFLIIANRGLWDYVSFQTAVDIARAGENANPMIAAQKLRDLAISYGAAGSIMIMVVNVRGLTKPQGEPVRKNTRASIAEIPDMVPQALGPIPRTGDAEIDRLGREIAAPTGHVPLVFTDIRNSTMLWETNDAMRAAHRIHNRLLRRWLRLCGGYEVKTEGDAFMCSFQNVMSAVHWCLRVQVELLNAEWPQGILDVPEGREIFDSAGNLVARGLSVRMGIHTGNPNCEPDVVTGRMDYFGPMVNRAARIMSTAGGGQIAISADVVAEVNACIHGERETEYTFAQPLEAIARVRQLQPAMVQKGAVQLKGIENAEFITFIYPGGLLGRDALKDIPPDEPGTHTRPRLQFRPEQLRELGLLAIRLEALASARVFRPVATRKGSTAREVVPDAAAPPEDDALYVIGDPDALLPAVSAKASEADLLALLDSLSVRIENALASLALGRLGALPGADALLGALQRRGGVDAGALERILAILNEP